MVPPGPNSSKHAATIATSRLSSSMASFFERTNVGRVSHRPMVAMPRLDLFPKFRNPSTAPVSCVQIHQSHGAMVLIHSMRLLYTVSAMVPWSVCHGSHTLHVLLEVYHCNILLYTVVCNEVLSSTGAPWFLRRKPLHRMHLEVVAAPPEGRSLGCFWRCKPKRVSINSSLEVEGCRLTTPTLGPGPGTSKYLVRELL